jgi:hypothetical protein
VRELAPPVVAAHASLIWPDRFAHDRPRCLAVHPSGTAPATVQLRVTVHPPMRGNACISGPHWTPKVPRSAITRSATSGARIAAHQEGV